MHWELMSITKYSDIKVVHAVLIMQVQNSKESMLSSIKKIALRFIEIALT